MERLKLWYGALGSSAIRSRKAVLLCDLLGNSLIIPATMILCRFSCRNCYEPMLLPLHTILQGFVHRETPPTDVPCIAIMCSQCKTLENYSAADLKESAVAEIGPTWEVADWLRCVEETCKSPVPVFLEWNESTTLEDRQKDIYALRWKPLKCDKGHEVRKKSLWKT